MFFNYVYGKPIIRFEKFSLIPICAQSNSTIHVYGKDKIC